MTTVSPGMSDKAMSSHLDLAVYLHNPASSLRCLSMHSYWKPSMATHACKSQTLGGRDRRVNAKLMPALFVQ